MTAVREARRTSILGAAGRDFHNFNVVFRDDPSVEAVGFTSAQIPGISPRRYPAALAGPRSPQGLPIDGESELETLCRARAVEQVVLAYSDVSHLLTLSKRVVRARYEFAEAGEPTLGSIVDAFLSTRMAPAAGGAAP